MKVVNNKKKPRKRTYYNKPIIINDYENIEDKKITLPKIINNDFGFEMQFGIIDEEAEKWFDNFFPSPYMGFVFKIRKEKLYLKNKK